MERTLYSFDIPTLYNHFGTDDAISRALITNINVENLEAPNADKVTHAIWFPYAQYFRGNVKELFEKLQKSPGAKITIGLYQLYSYKPKYKYYEPNTFRGQFVHINSSREDYYDIDIITDFYTEPIRLLAKRNDQDKSILESWNDSPFLYNMFKEILSLHKADSKVTISPHYVREAIYKLIHETKIFNSTWIKGLFNVVFNHESMANKKWLDISAGWGDRLITAISLNMEYLGFDPNIRLKSGHDKMIADFGNTNVSQRVIYEPFETAEKYLKPNYYDVVMSSPPFFDLEIYADNQSGQSIVSFNSFNAWLVNFLFKSLLIAWNSLKENGYMILYIGDTQTMSICEPMLIFIENFLLGSTYEGVIGVAGEQNVPRPAWVFKKETVETRKLWSNTDYAKRSLNNSYPQIYFEIYQSKLL